jgi:hypothetical protein
MPPVYTYLEGTADNSPMSASFTRRSQTAGGPYITTPVTFADMPNRLIDVLGYTNTKVLGGRLNRVLPLRHPQYQWLFADSFRPRGVGANSTTLTPSPGPGSSIVPQFPLYNVYNCDISFSQRDYNVWQDADIQVVTDTGYDKADTPYTFTYATEWLRFCTFNLTPINQFISAQQGQMRFRASGTGGAVRPDTVQYQDAPKMYLPDSALTVRWYEVPYRYLTSPNSYLRNFIGHINQQDWGELPVTTGLAPTFGPYKAGSLLYHGAKPTAIYSNVVPDPGLLAFNKTNGFARSLLCDLELAFTYTARTIGTPSLNTPDFSTVNRNWIVAGHNLLPWLTTRLFYYATTEDTTSAITMADKTKWFPTFNSFPFSLFFTDPDAGGSPALNP